MLTKEQTKFPFKALNESINWELMTDLSKTYSLFLPTPLTSNNRLAFVLFRYCKISL